MESQFWGQGQPDNKNGSEDCMLMRVAGKNSTFNGTSFHDRRCSDRYIFACEVRLEN
jgi:hypothetical protein